MLGDTHIAFLEGFQVDVREVDIIEFHAAQLLQLLLDTTAHFQRQHQDFFHILLGKLTIRVNQLQVTVYHSADSNGITLVQVLSKPEIVVQRITVLFLT